MSDDGAHLGIDAKSALGLVMGKDEEEAPERVDPAGMRKRILAAATRGGGPLGYDDCGEMAAGMVLMFYEAHPEATTWPVERAHHWERDGQQVDPGKDGWEGLQYVGDGPDLYAEVNSFTDGKLDGFGLTGFLWGWAVNAARYALDLPPEPNPAIITVGSSA